MMLRIVLFLLISQVIWAQELPAIFEDYLEHYEAVDEDFLSTIYQLLEEPLNLNECSVNDLKQLPFISLKQAKAIIRYRKDKGRFRSIYELQAIAAMDKSSIRLLVPFVKVSEMTTPTIFNVKHRLRFYLQRYLEQEKEYLDGDYVGNPYKSYMSYSAQSKTMNWGLTTEKDAGEKWLDFNSMYFNMKGKNNRLFLGDYQLSLGQGLLCYQGFSFGKSAQVLATFKNAAVLRSHSSTREYNFMRGVAYQHSHKKWQFSAFLSSNKHDANVLDSSAIFSSVLEGGLHRTISELEDKKQLQNHLLGSRLGYETQNFKTSVYSLTQAYNKPLILGQDTLSKLWGLAWHYSFTLKNTHFFGEYAFQQNSSAFLSAFNSQLAPDLSFSSLYRKYDSQYYAMFSNAFSEQSNSRNESGLYSAISLDVNYNWKLSFYADFYHFPKASYYSDAPLRGRDYIMQLDYSIRKKWQFSTRCKYEIKNQDMEDDFGLKTIDDRRQLKFLLHWKYTLEDFNFKSRIDWNTVEEEVGYMMVQELNYQPMEKVWSIALRYAVFDTPSFASRIYAYEPDVMYSFSVPFHYGEGQRISSVFKCKFKQLTLNFKIAQTLFYDNTSVKSGSVEGNKSTEMKLVLKWVF